MQGNPLPLIGSLTKTLLNYSSKGLGKGETRENFPEVLSWVRERIATMEKHKNLI